MKKLLSLILAVVLTLSLAAPASAAGAADQRLAAVAAKVKETLDLDTSRYTNFYGDLDDNPLTPSWYLEWSDDEGASLTIQATEDGKVLSYSAYEASTPSSSGAQTIPSFPKGDLASAQAAALAFLDKVLTEGETARMAENTAARRLGSDSFRFSGEVLVNGLRAGLSFSVTVRSADNEITRFYRDDLGGMVMGGVPSAEPSVTAEQAATALRGTLSLRLEYVRPEEGNRAVLRWLPNWGDEFYVDALSGELVNLSELYRKAANGGLGAVAGWESGADADVPAEAPEAGLTPAEQEGIAKLEGVLDRDALDAKVRAITALGLDSYALATASYTVAREAGEGEEPLVTASLRYGKQVDGVSWRRTVTVNARTGELLSVYSSGRLADDAGVPVDFEKAQASAEAFLTEMAGAQFTRTELYDSTEAAGKWSVSHGFTYAQKENGYFFPDNGFTVGIDASDGSVSGYSKYFDDSVTFDSAEGICTEDAALDAWLATYDAELQYVMVPSAIDFSQPEYAPLEGYGLSYLYKLTLGYRLEREETPLGIDAKTVQPVYLPKTVRDEIAYDDISGHWAQAQIETLAQYGVGYPGGTFQPGKALTQLDLVALLVSAQGYAIDPEGPDATDLLYDMAYRLGILSREDRDDGAVLTRAQAVKLILDAAGYGSVAQLTGIFRTDFSDDGDIPAAYYGYAALAQGLGMVHGSSHRFLPNAAATRAEAAVMLYNLMSR